MTTKHKLGFGNGKLIEGDDGTVTYVNAGSTPWTVRPEDVTTFVRTPGGLTKCTVKIIGHGTELAEVTMPPVAAMKVEEWFRAHPRFGGNGAEPAASSAPSGGLADELAKLAALRDQGVLTDDEFAAQKAKLLG